MNKKLMFKKGYMLEVSSWENDGDNSKTESVIFDTKEEAALVNHMCKTLFQSYDNKVQGIGNLDEYSKTAKYTIFNYLVDNQEILKINNLKTIPDFKEKIISSFDEANEENYFEYIYDYFDKSPRSFDDWLDLVMETYNSALLGYSEYYYSRVYDSSKIYYIKEDIYFEEIV